MNDFDINEHGTNINENGTNSNHMTNNTSTANVDDVKDNKSTVGVSDSEHQYSYGISYGTQAKSTDHSTGNLPHVEKRSHFFDMNRRRMIINICLVVFVLLVNVITINLGFKWIAHNYSDEQTEDEVSPKVPTITIVQVQDATVSSGESTEQKPLSKNEVWQKVKDTAVEIKAESLVDETYGQYKRTVNASGVIVANDSANNKYYILTNHHVVTGAQMLTVSLSNGKIFEAEIVGCDVETDLAVISIVSQEALKCASFGVSDNLSVGEDVLTIGNPLGSLGGTASDGIISAVEREVLIDGVRMTLLQTNVAANRGNSGGGLFNMSGNLVGVMNSKYVDEEIEGISFAIPGDTAKDIMVELIAYGYVKGRPDLGLVLSEKTRTYFGSIVGSYVIVTDPQNNENIEVNDLIYSVDGKVVSTCNDIKAALSDKEIGEVVKIEISRNRTIIEMYITIVERVPNSGSVEFAPET